jgi:hypothetical protein
MSFFVLFFSSTFIIIIIIFSTPFAIFPGIVSAAFCAFCCGDTALREWRVRLIEQILPNGRERWAEGITWKRVQDKGRKQSHRIFLGVTLIKQDANH